MSKNNALQKIESHEKLCRIMQKQTHDKIKAPIIQRDNQTRFMVPNQEVTGSTQRTGANIKTPPLSKTPMPVKMVSNAMQKDPITNLTRTETALLSPTEKVIAGRT